MGNRLKSIDVLRGIALLLIFARHNEASSAHFPWLNTAADFFKRGGVVGVDLFFVLSGFLIASLLFGEYSRHGHIDYPRFLLRRGFKIYPSYYLMIGITLAVFFCFKIPFNLAAGTPFFVFLQNYLFDWKSPYAHTIGSVWGQTWSLAVEEHFYICLPLLLIVLAAASRNKKDPFRAVPVIVLCCAGLSLGLRVLKSFNPFVFWTDMAPTHLRADALCFGVLIAYFYTQRGERFRNILSRVHPLVWACAGVSFYLPAFLFEVSTHSFIYTIGFSVFYIGSGFLLNAALTWDYKQSRILDTLSFIGRYSYCIYLWHFPFKMLAEYCNGLYPSGLFYLLLYAAAPIAAGILLSLGVEIPLLRLRDKIVPSRSKTIVQS